MNTKRMSDHEYRLIRDLIYERFGITLGEQKKALIIGRLHKILKMNKLKSFQEYYNSVLDDQTGNALSTLVDRLSTNHTYFFREKDHFLFFQDVVIDEIIKMHKKNQNKQIRIWSAGCASGEEAYTLAMVLLDYLGPQAEKWDIGILATDISKFALDQGRLGTYNDDNISKLPEAFKQRYVSRLKNGSWQVNNEVKELVSFRRLNLMREAYPFKGRFQTIFCRNVMIYFDNPTRMALIQRFHRYTESPGYLFIGHSESIRRNDSPYRYIRPAVYQMGDL